ncbi:hypothetical protein LIER_12528 [Lithospermum erythrorhizon]|uniref:Uncharacterized protein n=1 Tax=Lithospermum erythrorhizon TaxID=34254 RepID=A0AAV3PTL4_LITER
MVGDGEGGRRKKIRRRGLNVSCITSVITGASSRTIFLVVFQDFLETGANEGTSEELSEITTLFRLKIRARGSFPGSVFRNGSRGTFRKGLESLGGICLRERSVYAFSLQRDSGLHFVKNTVVIAYLMKLIVSYQPGNSLGLHLF